jgi:hypothetical protein
MRPTRITPLGPLPRLARFAKVLGFKIPPENRAISRLATNAEGQFFASLDSWGRQLDGEAGLGFSNARLMETALLYSGVDVWPSMAAPNLTGGAILARIDLFYYTTRNFKVNIFFFRGDPLAATSPQAVHPRHQLFSSEYQEKRS